MLDHGLLPALEELVNELSARAGSQTIVQLNIEPSEERYEPGVEGHLFRIIQQACENALQHANAKEIRITGELKTNRIQLVVEDNGLGFSIDEVLTRSHTMGRRHYGVVVMRERAELINAELRINSTLGKGTLVELLLSDVLHQQWE